MHCKGQQQWIHSSSHRPTINRDIPFHLSFIELKWSKDISLTGFHFHLFNSILPFVYTQCYTISIGTNDKREKFEEAATHIVHAMCMGIPVCFTWNGWQRKQSTWIVSGRYGQLRLLLLTVMHRYRHTFNSDIWLWTRRVSSLNVYTRTYIPSGSERHSICSFKFSMKRQWFYEAKQMKCSSIPWREMFVCKQRILVVHSKYA